MDFIQQLGRKKHRESNKKMKLLYNILSLYAAFWGHISVFFMMFILENKKKFIHLELYILCIPIDSKFNLASMETDTPTRNVRNKKWQK